MNTLFVNIFGGPGVGKSTIAAGLFYKLKKQGLNVELVREYIKEKIYIEDKHTAGNQAYVTVKQYYKQCQVDGKVDVVITDSPILLGSLYKGRGYNDRFPGYIRSLFDEFNNLNILLCRNEELPYSTVGRNQEREEANSIDKKLLSLLSKEELPYSKIVCGESSVEHISELIQCSLMVK